MRSEIGDDYYISIKYLNAHAFFYVLTEHIWQDFGMFNESNVEDYLIQQLQ